MPLALTLASLFAPVANRNRHAGHGCDRQQFQDAWLGEYYLGVCDSRAGYERQQQECEC